jgi:hypothetical protein
MTACRQTQARPCAQVAASLGRSYLLPHVQRAFGQAALKETVELALLLDLGLELVPGAEGALKETVELALLLERLRRQGRPRASGGSSAAANRFHWPRAGHFVPAAR